jgi:hypothetical protein
LDGSGSNSTEFGASFIGLSGTPVSTRVQLYGAFTFLNTRGDLGRTPAYTQTDFQVTHTIKLARDGRYALKFDLNLLNAFNENNVLSVFSQISPDSLTAANFGISNAGGLGELNTFRAVFNGGLTNQILAGLANGSIARDARFNQPLTRQLPRQVRFGFRFVF